METQSQSTPAPLTSQDHQDLTGRTLGDYLIMRRLGQGGMGQVYLAEQRSLKRKVALKILKTDLAANPSSLQRFKAEAEAVARATHANIVQVYAIGEWEGLHYMALEYVEGRNLREYLTRKGPPETLIALSIMRQVAAALQRAAEMGIIHRDIKPENILLTRKGEAKVADFGLSRCFAPDQQPLNLTQSGITMGTPLYMSPEQVEGRPVDPRSDIYSFGVTCYHMLAGTPPFQGQTAFEVALQHVRKEPDPLETIRPDLPTDLCRIVHRMMAKVPEQRYQTPKEILKDLARLREGVNGQTGYLSFSDQVVVSAATPSTRILAPAPAPQRRTGLWLASSLFLALFAGAALGWWQRSASDNLDRHSPLETTGEACQVDPVFSPQKREQWLQEGVEQYLNPANGYKNPEGLTSCLHLSVLYLDQHRLTEADQLFDRLLQVQSQPRAQMLGELGKGVVAALRSDPDTSTRHFRAAMAERPKKPERSKDLEYLLKINDHLNWWINEALHYNLVNGGPDLKALQSLLRRNRAGVISPPGKGSTSRSAP